MEKQRVLRQPTTRVPGLPTSSSASLGGRGRLGTNDRQNHSRPDSADDPKTTTKAAAQSSFDALELVGPSLSEVLTFVTPPQPRRVQESQQDAGEDTRGGEPTAIEDHQTRSSSNKSLSEGNPPAKFDLRLSRSAVLGKLVDATVDNARKTQEYFSKLLSKIQCEITGLVLIHDATVVIFLETTAEQFVRILKQLQQQRIIDATSMKILANCDDNGVRILQGLYFKKIVINRSEAGEWSDDSAQQCVVETFLSLIKFVKKIGPMPPAEIRKCLTTLSNTDQTFLPPNDLVLWLLGRDELMTIDEYLSFFDSPVAVELESERVWPVHRLIDY